MCLPNCQTFSLFALNVSIIVLPIFSINIFSHLYACSIGRTSRVRTDGLAPFPHIIPSLLSRACCRASTFASVFPFFSSPAHPPFFFFFLIQAEPYIGITPGDYRNHYRCFTHLFFYSSHYLSIPLRYTCRHFSWILLPLAFSQSRSGCMLSISYLTSYYISWARTPLSLFKSGNSATCLMGLGPTCSFDMVKKKKKNTKKKTKRYSTL